MMQSKKTYLAARLLLGVIFFVFGLNGFLNFIPTPEMPENIKAFMGGMMAAPYFFPVLKGTEVLCGFLLLIDKKVPLALLALAPIALQIFLFHAFMTPGLGQLIMPAIIVVLGCTTAFFHRDVFAPVLKR
jgi:putative oxidoreductase